jgi:hypothetical protein
MCYFEGLLAPGTPSPSAPNAEAALRLSACKNAAEFIQALELVADVAETDEALKVTMVYTLSYKIHYYF